MLRRATLPHMSNTPTCAGCRRPISGSYVQADGRAYHPDCFFCGLCGRPIDGAYYHHDGRPVHAACYAAQAAPRCRRCGEPILGRALTALEATWHPACFVCAVCQRPIDGPFHQHNNQPLHADCFARHYAPRCTVCRAPLTGSHSLDPWGAPFCTAHLEEMPRCAFCGRLVPEVRLTRATRQAEVRCSACALTGVEDAAEARALLEQLADRLEADDLRLRSRRFPLRLLPRAEFDRLEGQKPGRLGLTQSTTYTRDGRIERAEVALVAIVQGLPRALYEAVAVHELGHVWLTQQGVRALSPREEEGLCELLAHRHLTAVGGPEHLFYARRIAENDDPIYGDGFRALQRLARRIGFAPIVKSLRTKGRLPQ